MDPSFSVLLKDENTGICRKKGSGVSPLIALVLLAVLFIAAVVIFVYRNRFIILK